MILMRLPCRNSMALDARRMIFYNNYIRGHSSVGRASASQAEGHGFESRYPLLVKVPARRRAFLLLLGIDPFSLRI